MTLDELLAKLATEPTRTVERDVRVPSLELLADVHRSVGMRLADLHSDPRHTIERRTQRSGHVLGPPATPAAVAEWRARWPRHPLPQDLVELVLRANGVHLCADLDDGRAYLALLRETDSRV